MADIQIERDRLSVAGWSLRISENRISAAVILLDTLLVAALAAVTIRGGLYVATEPSFGLVLATALALWTAVGLLCAPQDLLTTGWAVQFNSFLKVALYSSLLGLALAQLSPAAYVSLSRFLLITLIALFLNHAAWLAVLGLLGRTGHLDRKPIVLLFFGHAKASRVSTGLLRSRYRVLGEFTLDREEPVQAVQSALSFAHRTGAQELFVVETDDRTSQTALEALAISPIPAYILPSGSRTGDVGPPRRHLGMTTVREIQRTALNAAEQRIKRVGDILAATVGLILLGPILLLVAMLIKWDTPGPIIYRQRRLGLLGRPFYILKFRTMNVWKDGPDVIQATKGDSRITRVGKWLRSTSIDELPQLLNVLKGDMSIVGPRPHALAHDIYYAERLQNYSLRQRVRPGLTGWAQVNYHRGETPTVDKMMQRINLDLWYIDHWTPALDVAIILRTVVHLVRANDAH